MSGPVVVEVDDVSGCTRPFRSALNGAAKKRRLVFNPHRARRAAGVPAARVKPREPSELGAFFDSVGTDRLDPLYEVVGMTGLRRVEACGLPWVDVDLERQVLHVRPQVVQVGRETLVGRPKASSGEDRPRPGARDILDAIGPDVERWLSSEGRLTNSRAARTRGDHFLGSSGGCTTRASSTTTQPTTCSPPRRACARQRTAVHVAEVLYGRGVIVGHELARRRGAVISLTRLDVSWMEDAGWGAVPMAGQGSPSTAGDSRSGPPRGARACCHAEHHTHQQSQSSTFTVRHRTATRATYSRPPEGNPRLSSDEAPRPLPRSRWGPQCVRAAVRWTSLNANKPHSALVIYSINRLPSGNVTGPFAHYSAEDREEATRLVSRFVQLQQIGFDVTELALLEVDVIPDEQTATNGRAILLAQAAHGRAAAANMIEMADNLERQAELSERNDTD